MRLTNLVIFLLAVAGIVLTVLTTGQSAIYTAPLWAVALALLAATDRGRR